MESTKQRIIDILKKYTFNDDVWQGFNDSFSVIKDLKINSARMVDIVLDIEDEFGVEISDDELDALQSFGDMVKLVDKKLNNR